MTRFILPIAAAGITALTLLTLAAQGITPAQPTPALELHEWGTFTSVQDESGRTIGGINVDDEPVPPFVHDAYQLVQTATEAPSALTFNGKGILPQPIQDITMRLETPVIYFHLPPNAPPTTLSLNVAFHGGWLTQFYPNAAADTPGLAPNQPLGPLTSQTLGKLTWNALTVGTTDTPAPATTDPVWTAPRKAAASNVQISLPGGAHETERFLFYRGVAHLDGPLQVRRNSATLTLHSALKNSDRPLTVSRAWLADIRDDGRLAFRPIPPFQLTGDDRPVAASVPADFAESDYTPAALPALRRDLADALHTDGMNPDEAEALLATWEHSYFKSPGTRLLYMVPLPWTDQTLPLTLSAPATINRAMVGRIELINPTQRALLQRIAATPAKNADWIPEAARRLKASEEQLRAQVIAGKLPLTSLGIDVPPEYAAYLALGRFRTAWLLDEQRQHPTPALDAFTKTYGIISK